MMSLNPWYYLLPVTPESSCVCYIYEIAFFQEHRHFAKDLRQSSWVSKRKKMVINDLYVRVLTCEASDSYTYISILTFVFLNAYVRKIYHSENNEIIFPCFQQENSKRYVPEAIILQNCHILCQNIVWEIGFNEIVY